MATANPSIPVIAALGRAKVWSRLAMSAAAIAIGAVAIFGWSHWHGGSGTATTVIRPTAISGAVVIVGGPPPPPGSGVTDAARPDPHAHIVVTGTTAAGVRVSRQLTADMSGHFALKLAPGVYTVATVIDPGAPLARQPQAKITVKRGHPVRARITVNAY
jgi:hypothetical protein